MPATEKKTDYRFKILYALGMIFIVSGHCLDGGISLLYEWFPPYSFHLGLFAFCSGYFYKDEYERSIAQYFIKKAKSLLVPLYLWNFFYALLTAMLKKWGFAFGNAVTFHSLFIAPLNNGHQFLFNLGSWFVAPLFMIQVFNVTLRSIFSKLNTKYIEHFLFLLYIRLGMVGIQIANSDYQSDWCLALVRMLFLLPFFGAGIYYKKVLERFDTLSNSYYFFVIFALQLLIIIVYGYIPTYTPSWCNDFTNGPLLPYVVGFSGIAFWLRVSKILEPSIGQSKTVRLIADNTFSIMVNQFLGFMIVKAGFMFFRELSLFQDFDVTRFKTDIWYYYLPSGLYQTAVFYLIAGLAVPIFMQCCIDRIKKFCFFKRKS